MIKRISAIDVLNETIFRFEQFRSIGVKTVANKITNFKKRVDKINVQYYYVFRWPDGLTKISFSEGA